MTRARIRGYLPDGITLTATQYNNTDWIDGEWLDDRFGQAFILDNKIVGCEDQTAVLQETRHSFWDGVYRVELIAGDPDKLWIDSGRRK